MRQATLIAAGWALLAPSTLRAAPQPAPDAGRVLGRVVDAERQASLPGLGVTLEPGGRRTETDADGRFRFDAVTPGRVVVRAKLPGFEPSPPQELVIDPGGERVVEIRYSLRLSTDVRPEPGSKPPLAGAIMSTSLDRRTVERTAGALDDPFRALQARPGVAATHDNRNDLLVRGGGAIETLIRVDGFELPNPNHFGAHGGSGGGVSLIPVALAESIAIEPGGFSAAHGERASALVDIAIRPASRERTTALASAGAAGVLGILSGPLGGGRGGWTVSARRSLLESLARGGARAVPTYADSLARLEWQTARHVSRLLVLGGQDAVNVSSRTHTNRARAGQQVGLAGWSLASAWGPATTGEVAVSVGSHEIDAEVFDGGDLIGRDRTHEIEWRARGEIRRPVGPLGRARAGAAVKRARFDATLAADAFRNEYSARVGAVDVHAVRSIVDVASFAEVSRTAGRLGATAGMRLERLGTTGVTYGSPRVRGEIRLGPRAHATAWWGVYRQGIPYVWTASHPGNGDLGPVSSRQGAIGLEVAPALGTRLLVEAFHKRYKRYPVDPSAPARVLVAAAADFESPIVGELTDRGVVRASGIDSGAEHNGRWWRGSVAYSFWKVRQHGLDGVWRRAEADVPHQVRIEGQVQPATAWRAGFRLRYASGRPYTPFDSVTSIRAGAGRFDLTAINARTTSAYARLDLRAERTFSFARATLVVYGEVENAFDRDNVHLYEWDRTERRASPVYQWGRLPLAGVRLEF